MAIATDYVGLDPLAATTEVERLVVRMGQACSYKIGDNEMVRLREQARPARLALVPKLAGTATVEVIKIRRQQANCPAPDVPRADC